MIEGFLDKKYSHIFVDFDSTLYLWDNSQNRPRIDELDFCAARLRNGGSYYDPAMINILLIEYLRMTDAKIHLVTYTDISTLGEVKFEFINRHYPGLLSDWVSVSSPERKAFYLRALEKSGISRQEILMIDDHFTVVKECRKAGFDIEEPQTIMGLMYLYLSRLNYRTDLVRMYDRYCDRADKASVWHDADKPPVINNSFFVSGLGCVSAPVIALCRLDGRTDAVRKACFSERKGWVDGSGRHLRVISWTGMPA